MQVSNGDVWQAKEALAGLIKEPLPVKTAYRVTKLVRKVNEHLRDIEAVRVKLVQQYGTADDKGGMMVQPGTENHTQFVAAMSELMDASVELDGVDEKITLPTDNGLCLTPAQLMALEPFVTVT